MTSPTDTVTPEEREKMPPSYLPITSEDIFRFKQFLQPGLAGSLTLGEQLCLIAHVERVETELEAERFISHAAKVAAEDLSGQLDRALAKLKELGEKCRRLRHEAKGAREECINGWRGQGDEPVSLEFLSGKMHAFTQIAEAAEAAHEEVAGE